MAAISALCSAFEQMPHERRLAQDYAQVWHEPVPPRLSSVGVMVDSDDLHQRQVTWFDDLQVR